MRQRDTIQVKFWNGEPSKRRRGNTPDPSLETARESPTGVPNDRMRQHKVTRDTFLVDPRTGRDRCTLRGVAPGTEHLSDGTPTVKITHRPYVVVGYNEYGRPIYAEGPAVTSTVEILPHSQVRRGKTTNDTALARQDRLDQLHERGLKLRTRDATLDTESYKDHWSSGS